MPKRSVIILISVTLGFFGASSVFAEKNEQASKTSSEVEETGKEHLPRQIKITVPEKFISSHVYLKIDGRTYPLDKREIEIYRAPHAVDVELYSKDGRLIDFQNSEISESILENLELRKWRLHFMFGIGTSKSGPWKKVFLNGTHGEFLFELGYHPNALGYKLGFLVQNEQNQLLEELVVDYTSTQLHFSLFYEFVPFKWLSGYFSKVHGSIFVGVMRVWHNLKMYDEKVLNSARSQNNGALSGLDFRFPIINSLSFGLRYFVQFQKIDLPEVGLETASPHHNVTLGFSYDF